MSADTKLLSVFIAALKEVENCMNTIVDALQQARGRIQQLIGRSGGKTQ
jgi:ribosome-binding factor A